MTVSHQFMSVVICTYNRCDSLGQTIECVLSQETDRTFDYELIIVDNNSNDGTRQVVQQWQSKTEGRRVRYVFEPMQGISRARNTGLNEAKGALIAFTDDDVVLDKRWLLSIWKVFQSTGCDAVGGRVVPSYPENTPAWVKRHQGLLSGPIVSHDYGDEVKLYDARMLPFIGANLAFDAAVLKEVGGFHANLGAGNGTMGEDTDLFLRLKKAGKKIYYNGAALVYHPVEKDRMTLKYLADWNMRYGRYAAIIERQEVGTALTCVFGVPRYLIRMLLRNCFGLLRGLFSSETFLKSWMQFFCTLGMMSDYRKNRALSERAA